MKFCYNSNFTLPKQSQRSRSIFQDGSRSLGLFWKENNPSYNQRNTVQRETIFVTYCLFHWMAQPYLNVVYSSRKELASKSQFFPLKVDPQLRREAKMKMAELLPLKAPDKKE